MPRNKLKFLRLKTSKNKPFKIPKKEIKHNRTMFVSQSINIVNITY